MLSDSYRGLAESPKGHATLAGPRKPSSGQILPSSPEIYPSRVTRGLEEDGAARRESAPGGRPESRRRAPLRRRAPCRRAGSAAETRSTLRARRRRAVSTRKRSSISAGRQIVDLERAHGEDQARALGHLAMRKSAPAQPLRSPAFEKPQIGGVIDAAGEVGVFIVDANEQRVGRRAAASRRPGRRESDRTDESKGVSAPSRQRHPRANATSGPRRFAVMEKLCASVEWRTKLMPAKHHRQSAPEALREREGRDHFFVMRLSLTHPAHRRSTPGPCASDFCRYRRRLRGRAALGRSAGQRQRLADRSAATAAVTLDVRLVLKDQRRSDDRYELTGESGTDPPRSSRGLDRGEEVDPASYYFRMFVHFRDRRRRNTIGSIASWRSGLAIAEPTGRSTACSSFCDPLVVASCYGHI